MSKIAIFYKLGYTTLIGFFTCTLSFAEPVHQHGVANVNIVISKQDLIIELETPADNVLGFEHEPRTEQQQQHLDTSLLLLKDVDSLMTISSAALCEIRHVEIDNPFASDTKDDGHHEKHDEHSLDAHGDHDDHEVHSDFDIRYTYYCQQPSRLSIIDLAGLFKHFPNFTKLNAQWLYQNIQSAKRVTKKESQINFKK